MSSEYLWRLFVRGTIPLTERFYMAYLPGVDVRLGAAVTFAIFAGTCLIFFTGKKDVNIISRILFSATAVTFLVTAYTEKTGWFTTHMGQPTRTPLEIMIDAVAAVLLLLVGTYLLMSKAGSKKENDDWEVTTLGLAFLAGIMFAISVNFTRFLEMTTTVSIWYLITWGFWLTTLGLMICVIVRLIMSPRRRRSAP